MPVRRHDITVWIKNQSKEKVLLEVIKAYEACYPEKFAFYRRALRQLREVTIGSHKDMKGRSVDINLRVPTEPFLFLQTIIPEFGKDSDDIALLCRVWEDFAVAKTLNKRRPRSLLWSGFPQAATAPEEPLESTAAYADARSPHRDCTADCTADPCECGHDHEELRRDAEGYPGVDQPELHP